VPQRRPCPIAFLLTSFDVGGTERQMVELIRRLDRAAFEVHVACFHRGGVLEARATEGVASVASFPIRGFGRPSTMRQMIAFARWCRRIGARIVHTCELYANIFGLPGAALAGVQVRIGNRRELVTPDKTRAQLAAQRAAYRLAHAVVANSQAAAEQLGREGVPAATIRVIRNGIDAAAYAPVQAGEHERVRRIVTVANLRVEMGHDTLIDAASRIVGRDPDVKFWIVGDGPLKQTLLDRVNARGLSSRFTFFGQRNDVPALLAVSDLFVLPSRTEASPNSVIEAMAAGLPVIATRVGGIPELVEDGHTGRLIDPDAPDALADAVLAMIDNPSDAQRLGRAARIRAERDFSFERMVSDFEHLYHAELVKRAGAREHEPELAAS
jgi:glycosyltransferase involved in cell wall biosynthesis